MLEKAREKEPTHGPRKYTTNFTAEDRAKVGKYAAENGIAKAQRPFKELKLSESTIRYFRKRYLNKLAQRVKAGDLTEVTQLGVVKRGRKLALGETLDAEVKHYIKRLQENGTAVSIALVQAAAQGYLLGRDRTVLAEYGGHVRITWDWARFLLRRMGYVRRKATTKANLQLPEDKFQHIKASFLQQIVALVKAHSIPPELFINLDETDIKLVPVGNWSLK